MEPLIPVHRFITIAALLTGAAQLIFVFNLIYSRFWGSPRQTIPGKARRWNGSQARLRHLTTSGERSRWSITIHSSTELRARLAITSCRTLQRRLLKRPSDRELAREMGPQLWQQQ